MVRDMSGHFVSVWTLVVRIFQGSRDFSEIWVLAGPLAPTPFIKLTAKLV
jgi:hypothetical protein